MTTDSQDCGRAPPIRLPAGLPGPPVLVETTALLERRCERWRSRPALAIDTEFVRERTFFPRLGLIQVADGDENVLVDPLAIEDLTPLAEVFQAPGVVKVLHACGEDLEVFFHRFGALPRPIFDTQIAAAFAGLPFSLGYRRLVACLTGVDLPKGETRSKWRRRPLTEAQKTYAALDVAYLLPIYEHLRADLRRQGRESWVREELEKLGDSERFLPDPQTLYRTFKGAGAMSRPQLAVLRALCAWRENEARRRDLPRNFVVREAALPQLARRQPKTLDALPQVKALTPTEIRLHGRALLRQVKDALALRPAALPQKIPPPLDLTPYRRDVDRLRREVATAAEELGLPPELLANRRTVSSLIRRAVAGEEEPLPPQLRGWRRREIGDRLVDLLP